MDPFEAWMAALEARWLADLRLPEVTRALRALSSDYVRRRGRLREDGGALDGRGKRAAFALYYAPVHFLIVREIVGRLGAAPPLDRIVDLGCGTGAAGAAWAMAIEPHPEVLGIDRLGWALQEAAFTYDRFGLRHRLRRGDLTSGAVERARPRREGTVAAYTINELDERPRRLALDRLLDRARSGGAVLIVEPIARGVAPWWAEWSAAFGQAGGGAAEWRFALELPDRVAQLGRAAGLDVGEQRARSIWVPRGNT